MEINYLGLELQLVDDDEGLRNNATQIMIALAFNNTSWEHSYYVHTRIRINTCFVRKVVWSDFPNEVEGNNRSLIAIYNAL